MSNDNKEAKKEELLERQEARQLTAEELAQVSSGGHLDPSDCVITYDGSITSSPDVSYSSDVWKMHIR